MHSENRPDFSAAIGDIEAHLASEGAAEARSTRRSQDRRTDKKRGTAAGRATRKVVSQIAYGGAATLLSAGAIYEGSRAVTFIGENGARVVQAGGEVAGDILGEGEENPDAPYADGETSVSEVEKARAEAAADKRLSDAADAHESGSGN